MLSKCERAIIFQYVDFNVSAHRHNAMANKRAMHSSLCHSSNSYNSSMSCTNRRAERARLTTLFSRNHANFDLRRSRVVRDRPQEAVQSLDRLKHIDLKHLWTWVFGYECNSFWKYRTYDLVRKIQCYLLQAIISNDATNREIDSLDVL